MFTKTNLRALDAVAQCPTFVSLRVFVVNQRCYADSNNVLQVRLFLPLVHREQIIRAGVVVKKYP